MNKNEKNLLEDASIYLKAMKQILPSFKSEQAIDFANKTIADFSQLIFMGEILCEIDNLTKAEEQEKYNTSLWNDIASVLENK
jgi:hypothetical protein